MRGSANDASDVVIWMLRNEHVKELASYVTCNSCDKKPRRHLDKYEKSRMLVGKTINRSIRRDEEEMED